MKLKKFQDLTPSKVVFAVAVVALLGAMMGAAFLLEPEPGYYCSSGSCTSRADFLGAIFGVHESHTEFTHPGLLPVFQVIAALAALVMAITKIVERLRRDDSAMTMH